MTDPQLVNDIKNAANYKRTQITFYELVSVFHLLTVVLFVSFIVFVIEIIYIFFF
mgnify:CR=1 FL=1